MECALHPKKPYWEVPVQVKKRNMTLMAKDKKIFLFRKEANEADEGKEVIFKRSKKNLKISVSIQLKKPYSTFIKPYTKDE